MPLQLTHGDDLDIMPFERVTWVNTSDTPIVVDLDFIAAEADEMVHIHVDNGRIDNIKTRYKPTRGTREDKTLIGIGQLCGKRMEGDD